MNVLILASAGKRFGVVKEPTWLYRRHSGNLSNQRSAHDNELRQEALAEYAGVSVDRCRHVDRPAGECCCCSGRCPANRDDPGRIGWETAVSGRWPLPPYEAGSEASDLENSTS